MPVVTSQIGKLSSEYARMDIYHFDLHSAFQNSTLPFCSSFNQLPTSPNLNECPILALHTCWLTWQLSTPLEVFLWRKIQFNRDDVSFPASFSNTLLPELKCKHSSNAEIKHLDFFQWNEILSTFTKTVEFMSKYPVLSVIAVQKPEINTGMSRSSVQEVITWIREFEITEQNFVR